MEAIVNEPLKYYISLFIVAAGPCGLSGIKTTDLPHFSKL